MLDLCLWAFVVLLPASAAIYFCIWWLKRAKWPVISVSLSFSVSCLSLAVQWQTQHAACALFHYHLWAENLYSICLPPVASVWVGSIRFQSVSFLLKCTWWNFRFGCVHDLPTTRICRSRYGHYLAFFCFDCRRLCGVPWQQSGLFPVCILTW